MKELLSGKIDLVAIGCSAGGVDALIQLLKQLSPKFSLPIVIILHMARDSKNLFSKTLGAQSPIPLTEAQEKEKIENGHIYLAPPDYHLLVEKNHTFSLSTEDPVNFSRPSIDVFFSSAAIVYRERLLGVVLTGANSDGAEGLKEIIVSGGFGVVENPESAKFREMPEAAISIAKPQCILKLEDIIDLISDL